MKFRKIHSTKEVNINISKYLVEWDKVVGSKFQYEVKQWLKKYWKSHICLEEFIVPGSRYRFDLINLTKRIIVESHGVQHGEYNAHFHRGCRVNFKEQIIRDEAKRTWAEQNNLLLVEIFPEDLPLTTKFFKEKYNITNL